MVGWATSNIRTELIQRNINPAAVLEAAGCGFDDIVDVTTFHTDPEAQFEPFMAYVARWSVSRLTRTGQRSA
ncbi:MAG: RidA/YER057c/UK114 superfamily, group 7, YjgH-like protein [uncultured Sphingomonas sp.]|uniref:RidA/YER057c/UK114 superfamily, group 7, YjgH-like protein n=1 Tax=uncultured Sphingomonas sp. TaxID=158754 RepID=A0A6J4SYB3_9SPHN|nr:MAG: RidA/YER057c/UK114 superfamily, group 7, YjgH-like protein [uncultured Sphingomonas sp.]